VQLRLREALVLQGGEAFERNLRSSAEPAEPPPRLSDFPGMTTIDPPHPPGPDPFSAPCDVTVEGGKVLVQSAHAAAFVLSPDAAQATAERLLEAADQARRAAAAGQVPPFPPSELVSPHAA
jgi:hypothetical protein